MYVRLKRMPALATFTTAFKGLFGRALAHLKMAPALAPLKEQLLWRS